MGPPGGVGECVGAAARERLRPEAIALYCRGARDAGPWGCSSRKPRRGADFGRRPGGPLPLKFRFLSAFLALLVVVPGSARGALEPPTLNTEAGMERGTPFGPGESLRFSIEYGVLK